MSKIYLCSNTPVDDEQVKNLALCEIKFARFVVNLSAYDALIITSKNAIMALRFNQIPSNPKIRVFAIGKASAQAAKEYGFIDVYTAVNSHGNAFALEILSFLQGQRAIFICAIERVSKLDEILRSHGVNLRVQKAYKNVIKTDIKSIKAPPKGSSIIFTSPLNVKAFLTHFSWHKSYKAIAIGTTTAAALNLVCTPTIAKEQTLKECLRLAKSG